MANYKVTRDEYSGTQTVETSIVRASGATDGTTPSSIKVVTSSQATFLMPYRVLRLAAWNDVTGADRTVTVNGLVNSAALPLNDEIWMDLQYLGNASSTLASFKSTVKSHPLATGAAVAADGSTWSSPTYAWFDSLTTANVTLSNNNLTATHSNTSSNSGARSLDFRSSGKYYFEITFGPVMPTMNNSYFGVALSTGGYGNYTSGVFCATVLLNGSIFSNGAAVGGKNLGALANGDVVGLALDLDTRKGWFRKNGGNWNGLAIGSENPATNTGGVTLYATGDFAPVIGFSGLSPTLSETVTINTGQSAFANTPPAGFSSWTATWTPFKLVATLTSPQPQQRGYIYVGIRAAKPSTTFYIDPQIVLSSVGGVTTGPCPVKTTRDEYAGGQSIETSITRVGGATVGGTSISTKIATNAQTTFLMSYRMLRLGQWNDVTGADRTVTVYGTANIPALPLNDEIWMDVQYLGSASSPIATLKSTAKSHPLAVGAVVTSDGSVWNGIPAATTLNGTATNVTMSNGNLTATHVGTSSGSGVTSLAVLRNGKYYFEVTVGTTSMSGNVGLIPPGAAFTNYHIFSPAPAINLSAGTISIDGITTGINLGAFVAGDVVGVAIDFTNLKCWFRKNGGNWNNDAAANPATNVNGFTFTASASGYAPIVYFGTGSAGGNMTANFGQSAYANAAPSGFGSWDIGWFPFKLVATLTSPQPQQKGFVYASVRAGKVSSTYYIDPQIVLS